MFRIIVTYILPLAAPLLAYLAWTAWARKRAAETGGEPPDFEKGSMFWALLAGVLLMAAMLVYIALSGGHAPDSGVYVAPYLEDGKVVAPTFKKQP